MQFFQNIPSHLKGFGEVFQTNNPMVPFPEKSLVYVFQPLLKMVVKPEVLKEAVTSLKLVNLDLSKSSSLVPYELIKLPTATKACYHPPVLPTIETSDLSRKIVNQ